MKKNKISKIISVICAITLIVSSFTALGSVSALENGDFDLQALVDASDITATNEMTESSLLSALQGLTLPQGAAAVSGIVDFYKINAIEGAIETGSTYEGAVDGEILVPGEKGYVSAVVTLSDNSTATVILTIEPNMAEYSFASCSNSMADWGSNTNGGYQYKAANAVEKLVIPDEVTALYKDWSKGWEANVKDRVKCVVFNENITSLPGMTGNYWNALEVVSFKGNNLQSLNYIQNTWSGKTYLVGAFYGAAKLKHIRLPDSVTTIGSGTFYNCRSLTTLYMPENLKTIGKWLFFNTGVDFGSQGHNLSEITIPASVEFIGQTAFTGASSDFTVTSLTNAPFGGTASDNTTGISSRAFNVWSGGGITEQQFSSKITVRALAGSGSAQQTGNNYFKANVTLENVMGVAEAAARAAQKADKSINGTKYVSDDAVLTSLRTAYGNVSTITASFKNADWTVDGDTITNTVLFTKNGVTAELPITLQTVPRIDFQTYLDASNITVTNETTQGSLLTSLQTVTLPEDYTLVGISDFYKINAIEGAIETGSTYEGAVDGEILDPGEKGYVAAVVTISAGGMEYQSPVVLTIQPTYEEYSFASVSNSLYDWEWDNSVNKKWNYKPLSGVAAEKLIIPDEITELKYDWNQWWVNNNSVRDTVRCVVFNENITSIPAEMGFGALEVVVIKGNVTELASIQDGSGANHDGAFRGAANLKHIHLPDSLVSIGNLTFYGCKALTQLNLPDGLQTIGKGAFFNADAGWSGQGHNLSEITIPASVEFIGQTAFSGALSDFTVTSLTNAPLGSTTTANNTTGISVRAFTLANKEGTPYNNRTTVRALAGSGSALQNGRNELKANVTLEDVMGVAEALARAKQKVDKLAEKEFTDSASVLTALKNSYGNVSTFTSSLGNSEWTVEDGKVSNTFMVAKGDVIAEIPVVMDGATSFYADGASILTTEAFNTNEQKQGLRFYNSYESSAADKILVKSEEYDVTEFGVLIKQAGVDANTTRANTVSDEDFVIGAAGVTKITGAAGTVQTEDGKNFYTVYLKNIPQGGRNYTFQCRGYIKYLDKNGVEQTVYTDSQVKSVQSVFSANSNAAEYAGMASWFAGN